MKPIVVKSMKMTDTIIINTNVMVVPVPITPAKAKPRRKPKGKSEKAAGYRYPRIIKCVRRVSGIPPGAINPEGIINRNVNYSRISRLNLDHLSLDNHFLLAGGPEVSRSLRLGSQVLDRIHNVILLGKKSITYPCGPLNFFVHHG
jgi:hypothetical protein